MKPDKPLNIIIQAGGRGSRLESLTWNKPKCLVPIHNLPIIFHAFRRFPTAFFYIIADYKADILEKYLNHFASEYHFSVIRSHKKGTISGISDCLSRFSDQEPFLLMWSDLILGSDFQLPKNIFDTNYIGISQTFDCRWSYVDGECIPAISHRNGIAGVFLFQNKSYFRQLPEEGEFVLWLSRQPIKMERFPLKDVTEIGTVLAYKKNNDFPVCRPFNKMVFNDDVVIKEAIDEQGKTIGKKEINWYRFISELHLENIPRIISYSPLTMERIHGHNIFELDCLVRSQKEIILKNIITTLQKLHASVPKIPADINDLSEAYINKTFSRLDKIKTLVPFADRDFIRINGQYYRNIYAWKEEVISRIKSYFPAEFSVIHGDCTFSNIMYDTFAQNIILIDPRGYFGKTQVYGDIDYDWAKLYYSINGNYDQFNRKKYSLCITENEIELTIKSTDWEDMENTFFDLIPGTNRRKIKLLHALIWLSLTTYTWDDFDSICGAFYNGIIKLGEAME